MGHLINPISYRLGYTRNWGFSGSLIESKLQYNYLNFRYNNLFKFFNRLFNKQMFINMGIIFSHFKLITGINKDSLIIFLYDGPMQANLFKFYRFLNSKKKVLYVFEKLSKFFGRIYLKKIWKGKNIFFYKQYKFKRLLFFFLHNLFLQKFIFIFYKLFFFFLLKICLFNNLNFFFRKFFSFFFFFVNILQQNVLKRLSDFFFFENFIFFII